MDHPHGLIVPLSCRVREGTFASGIRFVIYRSKGCRVSHPFPWHAIGKKGSCQDRNKRNVLPSLMIARSHSYPTVPDGRAKEGQRPLTKEEEKGEK